jgi:hypothetical protein
VDDRDGRDSLLHPRHFGLGTFVGIIATTTTTMLVRLGRLMDWFEACVRF